MDFVVTEIKEVATGIKSFSFKPPVGSVLAGKSFAFTPGQYLSLVVDPQGDGLTAPRHYTVTSPPGANFLQCTVKKIQGGKVSTYMHEKLRVGSSVKLLAPFGVFTLGDSPDAHPGAQSAVLMSAGIGVTPMVNFHRALEGKVKLTVHVDSTPQAYAFRSFFAESKVPLLEKYTKVPGAKRPSAQALVNETLQKAGKDNSFYLCGPEAWMEEVQKELLKQGAKQVKCEVFGSQIGTGCPFCTRN